MESDDRFASESTLVPNTRPQSGSKADELLSASKENQAPSFANSQSANDEIRTVVNPDQAPQEPIQPSGPSDGKSELTTGGDDPKQEGPTVTGTFDVNDDSSSDYITESEGEISGEALLWCRTTKRNHGDLVGWGVTRCPACSQRVKQPKPKPTPETQIDSTGRRRGQFRYSNKFLWSTGVHMFSEPWPDLLDLDRDRGKLAMAKGSTDESVLEIVTVVATNLSPNSRARNNTNWIISNSSVGTQTVGKEVIIHSRRVMDALQFLIKYYPDLDLGGLAVRIPQPYALFYHHINEIKAFQDTHHRPKEDQPANDTPTPGSKRTHIQTCDEETYKHLEILREVIENDNLTEVQEELDRHHQSPAVATYSMLWLLFKPGTKVYIRRLGSPVSAGVVLSIQGGDLDPGKSEPFSIDYWTLGFDGARLGRLPHNFVIKPFVGERRISELEITPCNFYDAEDSGALRDHLINRGQKYWKFLPGFQVDYEGKLPKDQSDWQGRVIIDPMTYYRYAYSDPDHPLVFRDPMLAPQFVGNIQDSGSALPPPQMRAPPPPVMAPPNRPPPPMMPVLPGWKDPSLPSAPSQKWQIRGPPRNESGPWSAYDNLIPGQHTKSLELFDSVTGEKDMSRYLMCPPGVIGFDLKSRQWQLFDVASCNDVEFNRSAIDSLVMREERKSVIKSLVHRYTAVDSPTGGTQVPRPWTADFIKNKGEGQIFLLHGSPGVGKTYTAECIAEATRRPLLSLTCGDIGTNEVMAERTLSKWFRLAEIWGAVMLLDEADVFLEKRTISDLQRNSLVSVFLRIVEYYRGILFLTTNRVGQFDDAFISRIHTVIHYENFSNDEQDRIWTQFFKKLEKERRKDMRIDRSAWKYVFENKDLRKIEWNGRQIRNAFQTAVAFAEYRFLQLNPEDKEEGEKASLEDQDFAKVCEMTIAFQGYMASIHGGDEAKRARLERIRDDKFKDGSGS